MRPEAPLGVFDSGLGGLTVVHSVARALPRERVVYFGDTARVPYGNKSAATVTRLALEAMRFLQHFEVKAIVVACNSASAVAMDALRREATVPVLGVVEAGAEQAAGQSASGRIGVIGTRATVESGCYEKELARIRSDAKVVSAACPLFVPLVEEGWIDEDVTRTVAARYLEPIQAAKVDTVILGCTHYPLLAGVIQEQLGSGVRLIDSGDAVSTRVTELLAENNLHAHADADDPRRFFVSDQVERFRVEARRFLGEDIPFTAEAVDHSRDLVMLPKGLTSPG